MEKLDLYGVAAELYRNPRSVSSDFARAYSQEVAALASQGLLSTRLPARTASYGRLWRLTARGVTYLEEQGLL